CLYHLIYASQETHKMGEDEILELLSKSKLANDKLSITGMLLYDERSFFQVLEGDKEIIENLFAHIAKDKMHEKVTKIIFEAIPERNFSKWSMGYSIVSSRDLNAIDGLNDFFSGENCLGDVDEGRAKKLLSAFSDGRWRLS
ncbi:BLUF domain-containing protein, partial [Shewanella sp. T24-MNA-CIBAN-0130]